MVTSTHELFIACLPGLESQLMAELDELELRGGRTERGGVALSTDLRGLYRANLEVGLASHVLLRVARFPARSLGELVRKVAPLRWDEILGPGGVQVRAVCRKSRLYHSGAVEQRVAEGLRRPAGGEGDPVVQVRVLHDACTLSVDTSGEALHRRGWRVDVGKAPLREDLARALVRASGWDREAPFVDPMMGSGTIVLEAAAMARNLPPGAGRGFAFERTPLVDAELWADVRARAAERVLERAPGPICGSDRDAGALERALGNAARLGVTDDVELACAPLRGARFLVGEAPPTGCVVTNPPFGRRVGGHRLHELYQSFGAVLAKMPPQWGVAMLAADRRLALRTGLALRTAFLTELGGLKVRALIGSVGPRES